MMMTLPRPLHSQGMLNRYARVRSSDPEETRLGVGEVLAPHRMQLRGAGRGLATRFNVARLCEDAAVTYLSYGTDTEVFPGFVNNKYFLQIPVSGRAEMRVGRHSMRIGPGMATIVSPAEHFTLAMDADSAFTTLVLHEHLLMAMAEELGGGPLTQSPVFKPGIDTTSAEGRALVSAVWSLAMRLDEAGTAVDDEADMAREVATLMLLNQPHDHRWRLERDTGAAGRSVSLACDYIHAHLREPISLTDLCTVTGVPARTLRAHFVRITGLAPKAFIERERMTRVHADLRQARDGETVTGIALRWGVGHLARFAGNYHRHFGLYPSDTLRTRRRRH